MNLPVSSRIGVMGLPTFHGYGVTVQLYLPVVSFVAAVVYPPRAVTNPHAAPVIPTGGNMLDYARRTGCKALMTVPTFLEQWAVSQENVEELKKFEVVVSDILVCLLDLSMITPTPGIFRGSPVGSGWR